MTTKKKYKIPVNLSAHASAHIGYVEVDNLEEYDKEAEKLWESKQYNSPSLCHQCSNEIDLSDFDLPDAPRKEDLSYFKIKDDE